MLKKLFHMLATAITTRPRTILALALLITAGTTYLAATTLQTNTNQDDLLSEDLPFHAQYKDFLRDFGDQEFVYALVDARHDPNSARAFVDDFSARLQGIESVTHVIGKVDTSFFHDRAFLYMNQEELDTLLAQLAAPHTGYTAMRSWSSIHDVVTSMQQALANPSQSSAPGSHVSPFAPLQEFFDNLVSNVRGESAYATPFAGKRENQQQHSISDDGYLHIGDGAYLLMQIMPAKNYNTLEVIAKPLQEIRDALSATRHAYPNIEVGLTGRPILAADEMAATNYDMTIATIVALMSIFVLFVVSLRRVAEPSFALLTLLVGMSWTYGFATVAIGTLNLLSIVFSVILVGAGIEFGLHMVPRFREELANGRSPAQAARSIIEHTGQANWTAAITTAAALYSAYLTDFLALRELGIIAGTGILLCFLSMLTVLPALLQWHAERTHQAGQARERIMPIASFYNRPRSIIVAVALIIVAYGMYIPEVGFNHNLLSLQVQNLESVEYERRITEESEHSTWQAVITAPDLARADLLAKKIQALPSVGIVEYARDLIPSGQATRLEQLQATAAQFDPGTSAIQRGSAELHVPMLTATLARFSYQLGQLAHHFTGEFASLGTEAKTLQQSVNTLRGLIRQGSPKITSQLRNYQEKFVADMQQQVATIDHNLRASEVTFHTLPDFFRTRYQGQSGAVAIYITPREDIWIPENMATFVSELRSIDSQVTGVPIEVFEASQLMEQSFYRMAAFASAIIVLLLLIEFRSLRDTLLALTPTIVGLSLLLGCMGRFGIALNLANFFAMPIILGIGLNDGAQIMHRIRESDGYFPSLMTHSTGYGVVLASLTAFASFASMILASHRGLASLGLILALGIGFCMVGSTLVLPNVLQLVYKRREARSDTQTNEAA